MERKFNDAKRNIGARIREAIIPKGMSVKDAANLLGVGRPALSNLLNGHAALSPDMATRFERAFGASARELMDMQAAYDTTFAQEKGIAATAKLYIPPFMQFKANDIEQWASTIRARTRFAVFLRTLVNSTGLKIKKIDFPGNDDAERPGWDGLLETEEGTPWVPAGISGWEFGTNDDPKQKADKDYQKSVAQTTSLERSEITFVFITPRRWTGKAAWQKERLAEGNWKDVLVFDASDLEQWLEQSIPAQAWLASELSIPAQGVISLDECWKQWVADSEPVLSQNLFEDIVTNVKDIVLGKFSKSEPLIIASDSPEEALAFLCCLFSSDDPDLLQYRDRIAVFTQPGALSKLAAKPSDFIAVITKRDIEREFAPYKKELRSIIIYPRNSTNADVDIFLEPLNYESFRKALEKMGCNKDQIDRLGHESGRSLTVLRRRLSKLEAIRTPEWASDSKIAAFLVDFLFAGAWDSSNEADKVILSLLANDIDYDQLENRFADLRLLDDSPVWAVGRMRGLVSKIDALYAINGRLVWRDIERFFNVAQLVLSEDDPSLDLPEDQQWAASLYGKTRQISSTLRNGISDSLLLLAVHGNSLFRDRLGNEVETKINKLIETLLRPLTSRTLESQSSDLPVYAEAAPETFLQIIDDDLNSDGSQTLALMRPVQSGMFGRNPRTGLLWALECIAWSPEYLLKVIRILAELSQPVINDNWANKPIESLKSIFRGWMPQTTASLDSRIAALEYLVKRYPKIAWTLCVEQLDSRNSIGHYNNKPRWRTGAHGAGDPVKMGELRKFVLRALEIALNWSPHSAETLSDLVSHFGHLPEEYQNRIWSLIEVWSKTATDSERSILREKIRTNVFTRRARKKKSQSVDRNQRAHQVYMLLEPQDIITRHDWLFKKQWVEESYDELEEEELDFTARSTRIELLRRQALTAIWSEHGLDGVLELASRGECATLIGSMLTSIFSDNPKLLKLGVDIIELGPLADSKVHQFVISGFLYGLIRASKVNLIEQLIRGRDIHETLILLFQAPFDWVIWEIVERLDPTAQRRYWKEVTPNLSRGEEPFHLQYAVQQLLAVNRPRAAFLYVQYDLSEIPTKTLYNLLLSITTMSEEPAGTYQLDGYHIAEAFKLLTQSGDIPVDQMAGLEFQFIEALSREESGIPNLEKHIEAHPALFVHAVAMAYKRADGGEDPEGFLVTNQQIKDQRAVAAHHLLNSLTAIPGRNKQGELIPDIIESWVWRVRELAEELSRRDVCDICLGQLFSNAPVGKDGVWPCEAVREAMEQIATNKFSSGVCTGLYNARGVHWRSGEGGEEERQLAEKYENWAKSLEFSYPRVAEIHRQMARSYRRDAMREDSEAELRRRLLD